MLGREHPHACAADARPAYYFLRRIAGQCLRILGSDAVSDCAPICLGGLCGSSLRTLRSKALYRRVREGIAKGAKKVKRRHYRILRVNVRIQQLMMN
jgi:hypothetical protein